MYYYKKPEEILANYRKSRRRAPWWSKFLLPVNLVLLSLAFWLYASRVGGNPVYLKKGMLNFKILKSGALQVSVNPKKKLQIHDFRVVVNDGRGNIFEKEFEILTFSEPRTFYINFSEATEKSKSSLFTVKVSFESEGTTVKKRFIYKKNM